MWTESGMCQPILEARRKIHESIDQVPNQEKKSVRGGVGITAGPSTSVPKEL